MKVEFKIVDNDGSVLTQGSEEVLPNFSMHDFLNKTIPGWEQTIKTFFNQKASGGFEPAFKADEAPAQASEPQPAESDQPAGDPEGRRMANDFRTTSGTE